MARPSHGNHLNDELEVVDFDNKRQGRYESPKKAFQLLTLGKVLCGLQNLVAMTRDHRDQ